MKIFKALMPNGLSLILAGNCKNDCIRLRFGVSAKRALELKLILEIVEF